MSREKYILEDAYKIQPESPYFYCMQPALWKRENFLDLHRECRSPNYIESIRYSVAAVKLGMLGSYLYKGEPLRGSAHYDSHYLPYIATGLLRRKWNTLEYCKELKELTEEYGIDMGVRGHYNPEETLAW